MAPPESRRATMAQPFAPEAWRLDGSNPLPNGREQELGYTRLGESVARRTAPPVARFARPISPALQEALREAAKEIGACDHPAHLAGIDYWDDQHIVVEERLGDLHV
jgi:hypothetical protein